jgi:hypothetical protein
VLPVALLVVVLLDGVPLVVVPLLVGVCRSWC